MGLLFLLQSEDPGSKTKKPLQSSSREEVGGVQYSSNAREFDGTFDVTPKVFGTYSDSSHQQKQPPIQQPPPGAQEYRRDPPGHDDYKDNTYRHEGGGGGYAEDPSRHGNYRGRGGYSDSAGDMRGDRRHGDHMFRDPYLRGPPGGGEREGYEHVRGEPPPRERHRYPYQEEDLGYGGSGKFGPRHFGNEAPGRGGVPWNEPSKCGLL